MKTILYINNDMVRILQAKYRKGEIDVLKTLEYQLEQGSVVNGVLINANEIRQIIKNNEKILDKAIVVLNSSNIQIKKLEHPGLKGVQFNNYLKNEFFLPEDGSIIYGVTSRKEGKTYKSLFMGVPREFIESYINLFKEVGLTIGGFEILQNGMAHFVKTRKNLADQTFVLSLIEGNNLISVLIENGEYILTDRSKIMAEAYSDAFLDELLQKFSSMIQFNQSKKSLSEISAGYYVGLPASDLKRLQDKGVENNIGLDLIGFIGRSGLGESALTHFCCYLGLMGNKKDIDLLKNYKKQIKSKRHVQWGALAVAMALFITAGAFAWIKTNNTNTEIENFKLTQKISSTQYEGKLAELIEKQTMITKLPVIKDELTYAIGSGINRKTFTSAKLETILKEADNLVTLSSIEEDGLTRTLTIKGIGNNEFSSSQYVSKLNSTKLFSQVDYSGYISNGDNEYTFSVVCVLN
ncbi:MAG: hypothetical protein PHQ32_03355 [Firmicutes bacterium]|nr:hypothetical protein [Bacillota bacterium]